MHPNIFTDFSTFVFRLSAAQINTPMSSGSPQMLEMQIPGAKAKHQCTMQHSNAALFFTFCQNLPKSRWMQCNKTHPWHLVTMYTWSAAPAGLSPMWMEGHLQTLHRRHNEVISRRSKTTNPSHPHFSILALLPLFHTELEGVLTKASTAFIRFIEEQFSVTLTTPTWFLLIFEFLKSSDGEYREIPSNLLMQRHSRFPWISPDLQELNYSLSFRGRCLD